MVPNGTASAPFASDQPTRPRTTRTKKRKRCSNIELESWNHSFTPAINYYLRNDLKFKTDLKYYVFGPVRPWNRENDNTRENLRKAIIK